MSALTTAGKSIALTMRGVPDVAGDADPATGYDVRVDGTDTVIGGTSAVAPLWAALIARINASTGKPAGFINPQLYRNPKRFARHHAGQQRRFRRPPGWDACTGLGSPNGERVGRRAYEGSVSAGARNRPKNPVTIR